MEPSPLTQQARPEVFQQKIVELYEALFKVGVRAVGGDGGAMLILIQDEDDNEKSEGFWKEFFLLKPDKPTLHKILSGLSPDDLVHLQVRFGQSLVGNGF